MKFEGESIRYYAERLPTIDGEFRFAHVVRDLVRQEVFEFVWCIATVEIAMMNTRIDYLVYMTNRIRRIEYELWKGIKLRSPGTYFDAKARGFLSEHTLRETEMSNVRHYLSDDPDRTSRR